MIHSQQLTKLDKKHLWHPFTPMKDWLENEPLIIERGKGSYLYATNGKRYLDGVSSLWCNVHGHHRPEIDRAIRRQLNKIAHSTMLGLSHPTAIKLAEQLIDLAPRGLSRVFYSDDGSTAMEIALKMAFQFWKQIPQSAIRNPKSKFLTLTNAYHGDTVGSVSLGGIELFHSVYKPLLFSTIRVPAPYCYRCPFIPSYNVTKLQRYNETLKHSNTETSYEPNPPSCGLLCVKELERVMKRHQRELAALVIEPLIQCAAGMLTQPRGFLKKVRQLCTKYNVLMIADEVATGFGRTGRMFACQHEGVTPDIMAVAKGITGGYLPLAATFTTERIFNAFLGESYENKTFFHGHTYTGNPLACAAALANLQIFRREQTIKKLQPKIKHLTQGLRRFYNLPAVGDIRQCGFMTGIELVRNRTTREPYPPRRQMGHRVIMEARKQGVILRPLGDVIVLMPPLVISQKELERLLTVTYWSIEKVTEQLE